LSHMCYKNMIKLNIIMFLHTRHNKVEAPPQWTPITNIFSPIMGSKIIATLKNTLEHACKLYVHELSLSIYSLLWIKLGKFWIPFIISTTNWVANKYT
jgi:hypothetical protein